MTTLIRDVVLKKTYPSVLLYDKHVHFLANYGTNENQFDYAMTDYIRVSGMYWALTALELLDQRHSSTRDEIVKYVCSCYDSASGGFSACVGHDPHLLHTLSAIQILFMYDELQNQTTVDLAAVAKFVRNLQQPDGSFSGDKWGEIDVRFSFCAVATLSLLGFDMDDWGVDVDKAVEFVQSCMNFDGGFGSRPYSESHAGLVYCALGFLSVTHRLEAVVHRDKLAWWLCERQLPSGGLNGRPEKLPDVCYSWWVLASLQILGCSHWLDGDSLKTYILACQDPESGGFADRPEDMPDPYHTLFGLAALALLGGHSERIKDVNATLCMPQHIVSRLRKQPQMLTS